MKRTEAARGSSRIAWFLLALIVLGAGTLRWRLLDAPIERDEGEYATMGQLMLRGYPPYARAYNMKLPGIYAAYAGVLALFGQTARGIHQGLLVANAVSALLLFLLARRLFGPRAAVAAAATFAALSLGFFVQGVFANAEHFVLPWALAGLWLLVRAEDEGSSRDRVLGGLSLGMALLTKQHGAVFAGAGALYVLVSSLRRGGRGARSVLRPLALVGASVALPLVVTGVLLALAGVFDRFWFWTFRYALAYTQQTTFADAFETLRVRTGAIVGEAPWIWALAAAGLVSLTVSRERARRRVFVLLFTACSAAAVFPGYFFRPHYFVLVLPAAALLAGFGVHILARLLDRARISGLGTIGAGLLLAGAIAQTLHAQRTYLFRMTPSQVSRATYGPNPFVESPVIADWIARDTGEDDTIAVLGSEPQIYFLSGRMPATGYLYTYALMEVQPFAETMQREAIREIKARRPKYLVWVNYSLSWLPRPGSTTLFLDWILLYTRDYERVARFDLQPSGTRLLSGKDLGEPEPLRLQMDPLHAIVDLYRRK